MEVGDNHDNVVRRRVRVTGRVQGVWYRETCRRQAASLGVAGWVRNNFDGSVEAEVEGPPHAVNRLVAWMREGPKRAVVSQVDVEDEAPRGEQTFVVR